MKFLKSHIFGKFAHPREPGPGKLTGNPVFEEYGNPEPDVDGTAPVYAGSVV
jgi:hypothetical protein